MAANSGKRRARGWERKKANRDTYEEILEAAAQAFARNGYDGTSLSEIAEVVGIKTPALYYHFKSKNDILYAYLVRAGESILHPVQQTVAEATGPEERLRAYVQSYIRTQLDQLDTMPVLNAMVFGATIKRALTPEQNDWVTRWERTIVDLLRDILEAGRDQGKFRFEHAAATAFFIMGSIDYVVNWFRPNGDLSVEEVANQYADLAVAAVGA
jgi:AcrR family transcriptional regulator